MTDSGWTVDGGHELLSVHVSPILLLRNELGSVATVRRLRHGDCRSGRDGGVRPRAVLRLRSR